MLWPLTILFTPSSGSVNTQETFDAPSRHTTKRTQRHSLALVKERCHAIRRLPSQGQANTEPWSRLRLQAWLCNVPSTNHLSCFRHSLLSPHRDGGASIGQRECSEPLGRRFRRQILDIVFQ